MTISEESDSPVIDQLVRDHVEREATGFDTSALVARVCSQYQAGAGNDEFATSQSWDTERKLQFRWQRLLTWSGMTAVAVMMAFVGGRYFHTQAASAATVLRDVQSSHSGPVDYCYRVQFDPDPRYWDQSNKLDGPSLSYLWTRGDRFWADCSIDDLKFKLGREENGAVWISPSPDKGIRFSNNTAQLPKTVAQICQINSMSVPKLLNEVLVDFDLSSDKTSDAFEERTLIWARLKPGRTHPLLSNAMLEIDPKANVLVRLVLWTVRDGKPRGTITMTLLESDQLDDDQYQLSTHLNDHANIETQTLATPDYEPEP